MTTWFGFATAILTACVFVVSAVRYILAAGTCHDGSGRKAAGNSRFPASDKIWSGDLIDARILRRVVLGLCALEFPDDRYIALLHRARINIAICAISLVVIFISLGFVFESDWFATALRGLKIRE